MSLLNWCGFFLDLFFLGATLWLIRILRLHYQRTSAQTLRYLIVNALIQLPLALVGISYWLGAPLFPLLMILFKVCGLASIVLLLVFVDSFKHETLSSTYSAFTTLLFSLIIFSGAIRSQADLNNKHSLVTQLVPLLYGILISLAGLFACWAIFSMRSQLSDRIQRIQMWLLITSLLSYYWLTALPFIYYQMAFEGTTPSTQLEEFYLLFCPHAALLIATLSQLLAYSLSENARFLQPHPLHLLLVLSTSGVPLFKHLFGKKNQEFDEALTAGVVTALRLSMKEAMQIHTPLLGWIFQDRIVMFEVKAKFVVMLLTSRRTRYLQSQLSVFATAFEDMFQSYLHERAHDLDIFDKARPLVYKYLG